MNGKRKKAHHRGQYHTASRQMNAAANADPTCTCWRDGLTLDQHPAGTRWTCGHVDDVALYARHPSPHARYIDGRLCAPEVSRCNYSHGATHGNQQRWAADVPESWWTTPAQQIAAARKWWDTYEPDIGGDTCTAPVPSERWW